MPNKAGTDTGRALGSIVGGNLAAFTAELGGKVIWRRVANHVVLIDDGPGPNHSFR
jgi:hypothetical protein